HHGNFGAEEQGMSPDNLIWLLKLLYGTGKYIPGLGRQLKAAKLKLLHPIAQHLHVGVLHSMRRFTVALGASEPNPDHAIGLAIDMCTQMRSLLGGLLGLQ